MSFFERNLGVLKEKNRELALAVVNAGLSGEEEVILSRNGLPIIKIKDIHLHSQYDPLRDARNWAEKCRGETNGSLPVVILGLGLGYHVRELLEMVQDETEIIVIEPRIQVLRKAMEHVDLQKVLNRIKLLVNEDIEGLFQKEPLEHLKDNENDIIVRHNPSVKANNTYFEEFLRRTEAYRLSSKIKLKIMVVSPLYGGSYPVAKYCVRALKNLGHDVDFLDNSAYYQTFRALDDISQERTKTDQLKSVYIRLMSEALLVRAYEIKPDLVFALAQSPISMDLPQRLRELDIPLAYWFVEDFREMTYWESIAPLCDFFFTIQNGSFLLRYCFSKKN